MGVVFPHADKIFGAEDEGFKRTRRILEHAGKGCGHERLAKADDIAEDHAAAFFKMAGRNTDRR